MAEPQADDIDELRANRREELREAAAGEADEGATPDEPIHVDGADDFERVIGEYDVVLVDFYADWCGPCTMLEPTIEALAADADAAVAKVDIDRHQRLAAQYGVQGVPNVVAFAGGEPVQRVVGVRDKGVYEDVIAAAAE